MTLFQIVFVPLCGAMALLIAIRMALGRISRRSGFFWTFVWTSAAFLISKPTSTTTIAGWLGIGRGTDLVLYLATLAGLAASIHFYLQQRRLEILVTDLIRRAALGDARHGAVPADHSLSDAAGMP